MAEDHAGEVNPYEPPQAGEFLATPVENPFWRGEELVVRFERTVEDWVMLSMERFGKQQGRRHTVIYGIMAGVLALVAFFALTSAAAFLALVAFILSVSFAFMATPLVTNRRMRRAYEKLYRGSQHGMCGEVEIAISPEGVREVTSTGRALTYWGAIERVERAASGVYLPLSQMRTFFIPARAFATEQGLAEFVAEAERLHGERRLAI